MSEPKRARLASVKMNQDFIVVFTQSRYRMAYADPLGDTHMLSLTSSDDELGAAVFSALSKSRFLTFAEAEELHIEADAHYQAWVAKTSERYGYKSKRAMFKDMKSCGIECVDHIIQIRPRVHERLEGWSGDGITPDDYVVIAESSSNTEVGVALKLAFSRCR